MAGVMYRLWLARLVALVALGCFSSLPVRAADTQTALVFGVYPYLSPSQVVEQFSPLAEHLGQTLGRPVELRSAPDFQKFIERTQAGEYDIIFTAPHMGRLAEKRDGYLPAAQTGWGIEILVVARKDGPIKSLADLRGHSLAVGAKLSMTYQMVNHALEKRGLALERDVKFFNAASFSNVVEAVMRSEADAGATGTILWNPAPAEQKAALQEIFHAGPVPGFLVLAHPRIGAMTLKRLRQALFDFNQLPAGKTYFEKTGQIDFRPLDAATLKQIDPYTRVFANPGK